MKLTELLRRYNCSIQFVTVHLLFLDNYDNCNNMHAVFTHSSSSTIGLHSHVSSLVGYYTLPKFPSVHWIRNFASSKLNAANRSKLKLLGIFAPPPLWSNNNTNLRICFWTATCCLSCRSGLSPSSQHRTPNHWWPRLTFPWRLRTLSLRREFRRTKRIEREARWFHAAYYQQLTSFESQRK